MIGEGTGVLFNSLAYAVFLPVVFILYWVLPHKVRWPLLLIASYYFYMSWNAAYVVLIGATTLVSYGCALLLEKTDNPGKKKLYVAVALFISLGILFVFKYYNFTAGLLEQISEAIRIPRLDVLLPVGISFYTFQTLSYVIDVYRGSTKAEHNLGVYATFVSFFPQLVAGPIERSNNLLPQITSEKHFDYSSATYGIRLILWGLYKKWSSPTTWPSSWTGCLKTCRTTRAIPSSWPPSSFRSRFTAISPAIRISPEARRNSLASI